MSRYVGEFAVGALLLAMAVFWGDLNPEPRAGFSSEAYFLRVASRVGVQCEP